MIEVSTMDIIGGPDREDMDIQRREDFLEKGRAGSHPSRLPVARIVQHQKSGDGHESWNKPGTRAGWLGKDVFKEWLCELSYIIRWGVFQENCRSFLQLDQK